MQVSSIIVKDLHVAIQNATVLEDISFSLQCNQHLAILGDSGSGKTTLAKALAEKIYFSGHVQKHSTGLNKPVVTFVEQRYSFKNLSGTSDFYYQQRFNSFDADDAPTVTHELLESLSNGESEKVEICKIETGLRRLGILHLKDSPLVQLSSGEHKRFQLVKALLKPASLLILDSPYTGLDAASRDGLNEILDEVTASGTQLILIPGTFPIPECVTHVGLIKEKKWAFLGAKEFYDLEYVNDGKEINFFNAALLPDENPVTDFETMIEMKEVTIRYGNKTIVEKLNWQVNRGEKWLLKGRNGAGKSSLLNLVTGDHPQAYSNEVYLFGRRRGTGESIWDIKQNTGYLSPESHAFFDKQISVFEAIGSGFFDTMGLYKKLTTDQRNKVLQWLDFLQLSHVLNKPLQCISTSQQRLTLLARALVKNPPLLILDEPCQGLDLHQRNQLISLIDHICLDSGKTLIYVSHDEDEIPGCIEKVMHLKQEKQTIYSRKKQAVFATA